MRVVGRRQPFRRLYAMAGGCAGGQSKRTNIGLALVTNPRVLFLDEPTSGLDSFTANEVGMLPFNCDRLLSFRTPEESKY